MDRFDELRQNQILSLQLLNNSPEKRFLWREACTDVEFVASPFEILAAEYNCNRIFLLRGYISVEELLHMLGYCDDIKSYNKDLGWSVDMAAAEGWQWIDFDHSFLKNSGVFLLDYIFPPDINYMEAWE